MACNDVLSVEENIPVSRQRSFPPERYWLTDLTAEYFCGRVAGTHGDSLAFSYIKCRVERMGYETVCQEFTSKSGITLRNVLVEIPGKSDSVVVIGAHFDGAKESTGLVHYPAANDNASGVVVLLSLLNHYKGVAEMPEYTIVCGFWDGEEGTDGQYFAGSTYFVKHTEYLKRIILYFNVDSVGHDHDLYVRYKGKKLVEYVMASFVGNSRFAYQLINMSNPDAIGWGSDYVSFNNARIPFISFSDHNGNMCQHDSHSVRDVPEAVSIDRLKKHVCNLVDCLNVKYQQ